MKSCTIILFALLLFINSNSGFRHGFLRSPAQSRKKLPTITRTIESANSLAVRTATSVKPARGSSTSPRTLPALAPNMKNGQSKKRDAEMTTAAVKQQQEKKNDQHGVKPARGSSTSPRTLPALAPKMKNGQSKKRDAELTTEAVEQQQEEENDQHTTMAVEPMTETEKTSEESKDELSDTEVQTTPDETADSMGGSVTDTEETSDVINDGLSDTKEEDATEVTTDDLSDTKVEETDDVSEDSGNTQLSETADLEPKNDATADSETDSKNECRVTFEIATGYDFSAPSKMLDSLPGLMMLTDCLTACLNKETCQAVNYETGLCMLFSVNADELPGNLSKSQSPVVTIYAQKTCLILRPCTRPWAIERVIGYKLNQEPKIILSAETRYSCMELCSEEKSFKCRSANYYNESDICEIYDVDRVAVGSSNILLPAAEVDYLENHCAELPRKLCEFKRVAGRILKTVDSLYQEVKHIDECRNLCLNATYRCRSYDFGDAGDNVCRLSHHSRATLTDISEPYQYTIEATTYELESCYNITIQCNNGDMVARVHTSKPFKGRVYAKGAPKSCFAEVEGSLDFELRMNYHDIDCNVQNSNGSFTNEVIIQHHAKIVTAADLGLSLTCKYDITNQTIYNEEEFEISGDIDPSLWEEGTVESPHVVMRITTRDGKDVVRMAEVGDPLAIKIEILEEDSPYEIFVRQLVALDGESNVEITLIDDNGCPTEDYIVGPIYKSPESNRILMSHFDAFKFPASEVVQFRAIVTPCMPSCDPVECDLEHVGVAQPLISYGRRKRRSTNVAGSVKAVAFGILHNTRTRREAIHEPSQDDMLLVQSIKITDKFGFDKQQVTVLDDTNEAVLITSDDIPSGVCINANELVLVIVVFILAQLGAIIIWKIIQQCKNKKAHSYRQQFTPSLSFGTTAMAIGSRDSTLNVKRRHVSNRDTAVPYGRHFI